MISFKLNGQPVLVFRTGPEASWQALIKSGIDFTGSVALLLATAPVMALAAIAVR